MGKSADDGQVFRITGARSSLTEDVRGRQRRYVISMLFRTVCVLLAVVLWDVQRVLAFAALAGAVLLPYFAVLIANAGRERAPGLPSTFDIPLDTPLMLGPGGTGGAGGAGAKAGTGEAKAAPTDPSQDVD
ncbi:DUF3099 domain-containing protein [Kitasatospora sp. NPDC058444]|uniref:DUF3099 domain-containing protein n=1 Tax=Kitasatospora sp. NPDC058444 TaxID=3346504 RepID=UPI003651596A